VADRIVSVSESRTHVVVQNARLWELLVERVN
jgi:hypothetical protein